MYARHTRCLRENEKINKKNYKYPTVYTIEPIFYFYKFTRNKCTIRTRVYSGIQINYMRKFVIGHYRFETFVRTVAFALNRIEIHNNIILIISIHLWQFTRGDVFIRE